MSTTDFVLAMIFFTLPGAILGIVLSNLARWLTVRRGLMTAAAIPSTDENPDISGFSQIELDAILALQIPKSVVGHFFEQDLDWTVKLTQTIESMDLVTPRVRKEILDQAAHRALQRLCQEFPEYAAAAIFDFESPRQGEDVHVAA